MIEVFGDKNSLADRAASLFTEAARNAAARGERFTVALSGGTTPRLMFEKIATQKDLPWDSIFLFWGDERHVPPDDPQSNYRMTREALLDAVAAPHVYPVPFAATAAQSAQLYEETLREYFGALPCFDLCFLGMGADGHTASLFPGSAALQEKEKWACASQPMSGGAERVTLTYPVLNNAAQICFLITGADKAATLRQVIEKTDPALTYPVQDIVPTNGKLLWLLDAEAAKDLTQK